MSESQQNNSPHSSASNEVLHTFSPNATIFEDRAHSWADHLTKASFFLIVFSIICYIKIGSIFMGLHCIISAFYQQQPCISDIYFVLLKQFRPDLCIAANNLIYESSCIIVGTCQDNSRIFTIIEYISLIIMTLGLMSEGIWGCNITKSTNPVKIEKFVLLSKFTIGLFEISLFSLIFIEFIRLGKLQNSFIAIPDKNLIKETNTAFYIYAGISILPQLVYWTFFIYIISQFSFNIKRIFHTTNFLEINLIYQEHIREISNNENPNKKDIREIELPEIISH